MNPIPPPSGIAPNGRPSNGIPVYKKKTQNVDPLFKKKPPVRPVSKPLTNGRLIPLPKPLQRPSPQSHRSTSPSKASPAPQESASGFSDPRLDQGSYRDYKLVTTKRALLEGLRFHMLQFAGDKALDIRNEEEFVRPVRLHRRDPRGAAPGQVKEEHDDPKDGLDKAEREELNARKEARQKEREENLAQIAPSANPTKKLGAFKKKTAQVWRPDYTAEDRRRIQTNYEEKLPWHLEDFDNKHCLVGSHQSGSANVHAAFVYEPSPDSLIGKFRLLPVEKLYTFEPKRKKIKTMTIEEAEAAMNKRGRAPDWLIKQEEARLQEAQRDLISRKARGLFSGAQKETIAGRQGEEADFDFEDDFADDEEGNPFEDKDEDVKIAEKKVKEDQLQANLFDLKEEKEYDLAEELEKKQEEARKKVGKKVNRALELREKNYNHGSDSDDMFDTTDSEEERERVEAEKKANREKAEADKKAGISSTGTNTPSGRKEKHGGGIDSDRDAVMKKSSSSKSLKRPGSPNLSEASGTDASARKKKKHRHPSSSQNTPQPSRPISPANVPPSSAPATSLDPSKPMKKRKSIAPGSRAGSDTETAAYSDGAAMSDGSKTSKRIKLNVPAQGLKSPPTLTPQSGSRAASPKPSGTSAQAPTTVVTSPLLPFPTAREIFNAIPANGISSSELLRQFKHRTYDRRAEFFDIVKSVAWLNKETRVLMQRAQPPAAS